jgi:hypothetical protein
LLLHSTDIILQLSLPRPWQLRLLLITLHGLLLLWLSLLALLFVLWLLLLLLLHKLQFDKLLQARLALCWLLLVARLAPLLCCWGFQHALYMLLLLPPLLLWVELVGMCLLHTGRHNCLALLFLLLLLLVAAGSQEALQGCTAATSPMARQVCKLSCCQGQPHQREG